MNTIYLLTRKHLEYSDGIYTVISNTGQYSWWCETIEEAWDSFYKTAKKTGFSTIENFINQYPEQQWRVIETYTIDTHPEYFI